MVEITGETTSFTDQFFVIVLDFLSHVVRSCRGHDRTVVGFTATYATSTYHH
jgi:hypothetical protein